MTRLSITADAKLLEETKRLARVRTKREAVEKALQEFVLRRKLKELMGAGLVEMDLKELKRWRQSGLESP